MVDFSKVKKNRLSDLAAAFSESGVATFSKEEVAHLADTTPNLIKILLKVDKNRADEIYAAINDKGDLKGVALTLEEAVKLKVLTAEQKDAILVLNRQGPTWTQVLEKKAPLTPLQARSEKTITQLPSLSPALQEKVLNKFKDGIDAGKSLSKIKVVVKSDSISHINKMPSKELSERLDLSIEEAEARKVTVVGKYTNPFGVKLTLEEYTKLGLLDGEYLELAQELLAKNLSASKTLVPDFQSILDEPIADKDVKKIDAASVKENKKYLGPLSKAGVVPNPYDLSMEEVRKQNKNLFNEVVKTEEHGKSIDQKIEALADQMLDPDTNVADLGGLLKKFNQLQQERVKQQEQLKNLKQQLEPLEHETPEPPDFL